MKAKLSKESEARILGALEEVTGLIDKGSTPNDALVKVASERGIPAGHVRLMVNAVNTGRTNAQRQGGGDLFEKSADFDLANAETVLEQLFPSSVKTKQAEFQEKVVSGEYDKRPEWTKEAKSHCIKVRHVTPYTDKKAPVETDPDKPYKTAMANVARMKRELEAKRMKLSAIRDKGIKLAAELKEYFRSPACIPFNEVLENAEIMFGKSAGVILKVATVKEKHAHRNAPPTPVDIKARPYSLIADCVKVASDFQTAMVDFQKSSEEAGKEAAEQLRPFALGPESGRSVMADQLSEKKADLFGMLSTGLGMAKGMSLGKEIGSRFPGVPQPADKVERDDLASLLDPGHEMEIRNIQSEALLNDLMANDDVVSGFSPDEVMDAYNEITQLNPYAVNRKAVIRDMLRKRLAGGPQAIDNFAISEALRNQQTMRDLQAPNSSVLGAMEHVGVMPRAQPQSHDAK